MQRSKTSASTSSFTALQAVRPHLELMRASADETTNPSRAGLGLLMLWLCDDIEQSANSRLASFGLSENKFDVLMFFSLAERGLVEGQAITPSNIAEYFWRDALHSDILTGLAGKTRSAAPQVKYRGPTQFCLGVNG